MIMASPRATSAAAIVTMNIVNMCPVRRNLDAESTPEDNAYGTVYLDKATALRLIPLNIISNDIKTAIALFLDNAPYIPIEKSIAPIIKKRSRVIGYLSLTNARAPSTDASNRTDTASNANT